MLYLTLKWLHVLFAIVALGANFTYGIWLSRAARSPETLMFTLRTVKILDDRVANPAYGLSLISGLAMVYVSGISLTTPWLLLSLILYIVVVLVGIFGYTPTLKQQIKVAEESGPESAEYVALARRGMILGIDLGVLVVAIVFLMVVKPALWG